MIKLKVGDSTVTLDGGHISTQDKALDGVIHIAALAFDPPQRAIEIPDVDFAEYLTKELGAKIITSKSSLSSRLKAQFRARTKGGPGSGNFNHYGRPGEVGGSVASKKVPESAYAGSLFNLRPYTKVKPGEEVTARVPATSVIDTPAFKKWFGDSKVVDDQGKPLMVFHGSRSEFSEFSLDKGGSATGAPSSKLGFFFANKPVTAESYTNMPSEAEKPEHDRIFDEAVKLRKSAFRMRDQDSPEARDKFKRSEALYTQAAEMRRSGGNVMPVYLKIENPLTVNQKGKGYREESFFDLISRAHKAGNDGVIIRNTFDAVLGDATPDDIYVAFKPNQIKSAIGNHGTFDPDNPSIIKEVKMIRTKGGKGSGNFGHMGRPGKVGGSGEGEAPAGRAERVSTFDKAKWSGMDVGTRKTQFFAQERTEQDAQADAGNSIRNAVTDRLAFAGKAPHSSDISQNIEDRVKQIGDFIHKDNAVQITETALEMDSALERCGVDPKIRQALAMDAVDTLATQDNESYGRQLGDHGIAHIRGNIETAMAMAKELPTKPTANDIAEIYLTNIYHDTGYLTEPSQMFLDEAHPRWSQEHFDANIRPMVEDALGNRAGRYISNLIATHDSPAIDWTTDPIGSCVRIADNSALFYKEKLPAVFKMIPDNLGVLEDMVSGKSSLAEAQDRMTKNIANSGLSEPIKTQLNKATKEVQSFTPKFTLGMLGGNLDGFSWVKDAEGGHMKMYLRKNTEATRLNSLGDFGQRQFAKFVKSYNVGWEQFRKKLSFRIPPTGQGPVLLEGVQVGEKSHEMVSKLTKSIRKRIMRESLVASMKRVNNGRF